MDPTSAYPTNIKLQHGRNTHLLIIDGFPACDSEEQSSYLDRARKAWETDATLVGIQANMGYRIYLVTASFYDNDDEHHHYFISFLTIQDIVIRVVAMTGEKTINVRTVVRDWRVDTLAECAGFRQNLLNLQISFADIYRQEQLFLVYARKKHDAHSDFRVSDLGEDFDAEVADTSEPFRQTLEIFFSTGNTHQRLNAIEDEVERRIRYYFSWLTTMGFKPQDCDAQVSAIAAALGRAWQDPDSLPFRSSPILPQEESPSNFKPPQGIMPAQIIDAEHELEVWSAGHSAYRSLRIVDTPAFRSLLSKHAPEGTNQQDFETCICQFMGPFHKYYASKHPGLQEYLDGQVSFRNIADGLARGPHHQPVA